MDNFDSDEFSEEDRLEKEASFSNTKCVDDKEGFRKESLQCQAKQHSDEELINIWLFSFTCVYNCICHICLIQCFNLYI